MVKAKSRNTRHRDPEQAVKLNGHGILRSIIEAARQELGYGLGELTVLSAQVDPYRLDTPSGHRDGACSPSSSTASLRAARKSTGVDCITSSSRRVTFASRTARPTSTQMRTGSGSAPLPERRRAGSTTSRSSGSLIIAMP
jgi:hypothetical protein